MDSYQVSRQPYFKENIFIRCNSGQLLQKNMSNLNFSAKFQISLQEYVKKNSSTLKSKENNLKCGFFCFKADTEIVLVDLKRVL